MYDRFKWNPELRFYSRWYAPLTYDKLKPSRIFVGSTMELFGDFIPEDWTRDIFKKVKIFPSHTFIFLTKQPTGLFKWSPFPDNAWVGVSPITNGQMLLAIGQLEKIQAKVKFLSLEPLRNRLETVPLIPNFKDVINWVIIGQQTPPSKKTSPKLEWIQEIVETCDKANIPIFLKNNLYNTFAYANRSIMLPYWALNKNGDGGLRQEFPSPIR